jgi:hypothetical protein
MGRRPCGPGRVLRRVLIHVYIPRGPRRVGSQLAQAYVRPLLALLLSPEVDLRAAALFAIDNMLRRGLIFPMQVRLARVLSRCSRITYSFFACDSLFRTWPP